MSYHAKPHYVYVCLQGAIYLTMFFGDDEVLKEFNEIFMGVAKELTFQAWYKYTSRKANQSLSMEDDIVRPFYDTRSIIETTWILDPERDILSLEKRDSNLRIHLDHLRQRFVNISKLEPHETLPRFDQQSLQSIYPISSAKIRRRQIDEQRFQRYKAFVAKLLTDLGVQWKHILSGPYNNSTFRKFAYAIIRIVTLNFTVKDVAIPSYAQTHLPSRNFPPKWHPASGHVMIIGDTTVAVCQHGHIAKLLMRDDFSLQTWFPNYHGSDSDSTSASHPDSGDESGCFGSLGSDDETNTDGGPNVYNDSHINGNNHAEEDSEMNDASARGSNISRKASPISPAKAITYLIITVREVALCRVDENGESFAAPERLFDGTRPPSDEAIETLLHAVLNRRSLSPFRGIPAELQDMIVDQVDCGPIERARLGCLLDAGPVFNWERKGRKLELQESEASWFPECRRESTIWFGNHTSRIVYR